MNNSSYWISLDIHDTASQVSLAVKKGDNSRKICVSLTENGKEYMIADGCTAVFTAKKSDGGKLYNDCAIEGNLIVYVLTNNTTSAVGLAECEFRLISPEDKLLVCPRFTLIVEDTVVNDGDVMDSSDEFSALSKMVGRVERADEMAQEALETADEALGKASRAADLVDGCEEATNTLVLTHEDIVSGGYVKALKELNSGIKFTFWVGTTDEYNALTKKVNNCFYILTDDASRNEIVVQLVELQSGLVSANTNITNLQSGLDTTNKNVTNLQGKMQTANTNITNLQSDVDSVERKLKNANGTFFTKLYDYTVEGTPGLTSSDFLRGGQVISGLSNYKMVIFRLGFRDDTNYEIGATHSSPPVYRGGDSARYESMVYRSNTSLFPFVLKVSQTNLDEIIEFGYDATLGITPVIREIIGVM